MRRIYMALGGKTLLAVYHVWMPRPDFARWPRVMLLKFLSSRKELPDLKAVQPEALSYHGRAFEVR